jgi:hypothetical protein
MEPLLWTGQSKAKACELIWLMKLLDEANEIIEHEQKTKVE